MLKTKNLKNPIVRNCVVIIAVVAILVILGVAATWGKTIVDWVLALGTKFILTVGITAFVCGVIFGAAEMRFGTKNKKVYDDDEE